MADLLHPLEGTQKPEPSYCCTPDGTRTQAKVPVCAFAQECGQRRVHQQTVQSSPAARLPSKWEPKKRKCSLNRRLNKKKRRHSQKFNSTFDQGSNSLFRTHPYTTPDSTRQSLWLTLSSSHGQLVDPHHYSVVFRTNCGAVETWGEGEGYNT